VLFQVENRLMVVLVVGGWSLCGVCGCVHRDRTHDGPASSACTWRRAPWRSAAACAAVVLVLVLVMVEMGGGSVKGQGQLRTL
jgi:hypothetical protein